MPKATRRLKVSKAKDEQAEKDEKYREYLKSEGVTILEKQRIPDGAQYASCDYCGTRHLVEGAGIGCGVCKDAIAKMPFGTKFILNAVMQRLTATEMLRTLDEQNIIRLQDTVYALERLVIARPAPARKGKKGRR